MKKIKINKLPAGFRRMPDGTIVKDSGRQKMQAGGQPVLGPTPRAAANLEAEKGETVVTDLDDNKIPENYNIGGKKHSEGGTPLNLPAKSFIFSDHKSMKIKGDELKKFTNTSKKSMTPAAISKLKKFDMTEDNKVLKNPDSDAMQISTAERNIQSKLVKLGELAMTQEGKKDFENGIPDIALPYLQRNGITPEQVEMINAEIEQADMMDQMVEAYKKGGQLTKYQTKGQVGEFTSTFEDFQDLVGSEDFAPLLDAVYKNYKAKNPKSQYSKEDMLSALMKMQEQNYTFRDQGLGIDEAVWDRYQGVGRNAAYKEAVKQMGLDEMSEKDIKLAQELALGLTSLKQDSEFAKNPLVQRMRFTAEGEEGALSKADALYGDNTAKTFIYLAPYEEKTKEMITPGKAPSAIAEREPIAPYPEDLINIAAVAGRRIPREYGYTQRLQPFLADPVFLDPERELQANQEVANAIINSQALLGRGQNLASNASLIQGKLAANQANVLGKYSNANSQIANKFELANTDFLNKVSEYNALQNRQQRMDTATVNQAYANARNRKLEDLSEAVNQMSSNLRTTEMLNDMYDNFSYNPWTGQPMFTGSPLPEEDAISNYQKQQAAAAESQPKTEESTKNKKRLGGERIKRDLLRKFMK